MEWRKLWRELPNHIKPEILTRLPAESLIRSRCVNKNWLKYLSHPRVIETHLNRTTLNPNPNTTTTTDDDESFIVLNRASTDNEALFLLRTKNTNVTFNLIHPCPTIWYAEILGSINGLVCVSCHRSWFIALWNPLTQQCKTLPLPKITDTGDVTGGFCYDPLKNDYKVVRVVFSDVGPDPRSRAEVYTTSSNSWREIEGDVPFRWMRRDWGIRCDAIVKGEPYWEGSLNVGGPVVAWFDAVDEVFRHLPMLGLPMPETDVYVGNFKNSLALAVIRPISPGGAPTVSGEAVIDVWTVEEDGFAWSKKYTAGPFEGGIWSVKEFSMNGLFVEMPGGWISFYCSQTKETKNVLIDGNPAQYFRVSNYTASLVSIRGSKKVIRLDIDWKGIKRSNT